MPFLPDIYSQMDGSKYASANCGPAVCTELLGLCTVDTLRIPATKIRQASGDTSGGLEGGQLATTVNTLTGHLYPFNYGPADWATVKTLLERISLGIIIDAGKTVRTKYRTNNFTGTHWLTVAGGTMKDGTVKYEDPGTTYAGWNRIPLQLLREASDFGGRHWVLQTPPTLDADKNAVRPVAVRRQPDRYSGRIAGLQKGEKVHVRKTTKGGPWQRADGTTGHGWWVVEWKGEVGYCKGEGLR